MDALNSLLTTVTDAFFSLWAEGPAWMPLIIVSILSGSLAAVVFRFTSRQDLLRRDAELIRAQLLAMKLFRDDLATQWNCLTSLLGYTGARIWHSLPPVIVLTLPFVLLVVQLARWYEHAPLTVGDRAIVVLQLAPHAWSDASEVALTATPELKIETPPLRDPLEQAIYWRIHVVNSSTARLRWTLSGSAFEKPVTIANERHQLMPVDARRPGGGWIDRLLYPGEPPFEAGDAVRGVEVQYPQRSTPLLGLDLPWWVTFLVVSLLTALLGGRLMKVQF